MPLTLRYSLQDSSLKPSGVNGEYARLQVDWRSEQKKIIISDNDYQEIINALTEGRLIGLQTESGLNIGQFVTGLAGGVETEKFISAKKSDARISFKSTKKFLEDIRQQMIFERIKTVMNNPTLKAFSFVETATSIEHIGKIPLNTLGFLKIKGMNFVKDGMTATIEQATDKKETANIALSTVESGTKHINIVLPGLTTPCIVGPAILKVKRKDNPDRFAVMSFEITS